MKTSTMLGLIVAGIVVGVPFYFMKPPPPVSVPEASPRPVETPVAAPVVPSPTLTTTDKPTAAPPPPKPTRANPDDPVEDDAIATPEQALQSMNGSLAGGDSRTPSMRPDLQMPKPSADILRDPVRFRQYEEEQSRQIAATYLGFIHQIPALQATIEQASISGELSQEDLAEARDTLAKMQETLRQMEKEHPDVVDLARKNGATEEKPADGQ